MLKVRGRRDWSAVAGDVNHGFGQEYHNEERICQWICKRALAGRCAGCGCGLTL